MKGKSLSCVRLLATPWTAAYQAPPSMGFSRQEYWNGLQGKRKEGRGKITSVDKDVEQLQYYFFIGGKLLHNVVLVSAILLLHY